VRQALNRAVFWLFLAPLFLVCAAVVPLAIEAWTTPGRIAIAVAWIAFSLLAALVIYDPRRFWLGLRVFAAVMFAGLAGKLAHELFFGESLSASTLWHFLDLGLPALGYTIWGPRGRNGGANASEAAKD
jgi:hypothetical protein